jgi:5'-nucleotidase
MRLLLTNDDGIRAPGLTALAGSLRALGEVTVVAPEREQSAAGHAITLHKPLRLFRADVDGLGDNAWASNGTPADCVVLGCYEVLREPPDLVIAGINAGANLGEEVLYSGTVSAAMEAALEGRLAFAISVAGAGDRHYGAAARFAAQLAPRVASLGLGADCFLNINVPNVPRAAVQGVEVTRLGRRRYANRIYRRTDPRGRPYFWFDGDPIEEDATPGTDIAAVQQGRISVTPLHLHLAPETLPEGIEDAMAIAWEEAAR